MPLELLSGPHDVIDINSGDPITNMTNKAQWVDPVGLVMATSSQGQVIIQMDGSAVCNAQRDGVYGLTLLGASPDNPDAGVQWYGALADPNVFGVFSRECIIDRVTMTQGRQLTTDVPQDTTQLYARVHDRWLAVNGAHVDVYDFGASNWVAERSIPGFSGAYGISWAREPHCIWIGGSSGLVVLYDLVTKLEVASTLRTTGLTGRGVWYSKKHDVFISLHENGSGYQTRVWARTVRPATISAPAAESTVAAGRIVLVKARVLGGASEPCPGEVVDWSLTGDGSLSPTASLTDADGWARTRWTVPQDASGDAVVEVSIAV